MAHFHSDSDITLPLSLPLQRIPSGLAVKPPNTGSAYRTWSTTFNHQVEKELDLDLAHTLISHERPSPVKFSHDGKYVAVGCSGGEAHIFEVETGTLTRILRNLFSHEEEPIGAASFSRDGKYLATGSCDGDINIWEIKTKYVRNTFQDHTHEILSLDFSPDGRLLVSTAGDNTVLLWDMRSGTATFLTEDDDPMFLDYPRHTSAVFSPDGRFLATSHRDGMLRVWGVRSGRLLKKVRAHEECVYDVAFMPNGKGLVSASQDRTLKYWDISSLYNSQARSAQVNGSQGVEDQTQPERVFLGHEGHVHSLAISPDGRWIASGSTDKTVRIWDSRNGMMQCTVNVDDHVSGVDFSPKGRYLASAGNNGTVRIWRYSSHV